MAKNVRISWWANKPIPLVTLPPCHSGQLGTYIAPEGARQYLRPSKNNFWQVITDQVMFYNNNRDVREKSRNPTSLTNFLKELLLEPKLRVSGNGATKRKTSSTRVAMSIAYTCTLVSAVHLRNFLPQTQNIAPQAHQRTVRLIFNIKGGTKPSASTHRVMNLETP